MNKNITIIATIILILSAIYYSLPFFGINIQLSELLSPHIPGNASSDTIKLAQNLSLKPYINGLDAPRFMYITEKGDLIVSEPYKGNVLLFPYQHPEKKKTLLSGLQKPHSMDFYKGFLYVAEENAVGRIKFNPQTQAVEGQYQRIIDNIPDDGGHWTRTIKFGPDGYAYLSIGSSCNACIEENPLRASIQRFDPDKPQLQVYATGLRNSVGLDWSPLDKQLYATENGRDMLGDKLPPEELNLIKAGQFYGWPYAYGNRIPDPKYGKGKEELIKNSIPPVFEFGAHQAPLGLTFIKNPDSPFYGKALVAFHGSWNSSQKVGYKIVLLSFTDGKITQEDFITGFLNDGKVLGRPVHIVEGKHGELYLSDDFNGRVYQIIKGVGN